MKEKKIRIQWELSRNGPTIAPFLRVSIWPGPASVRWICCVAAWMSSWLTLDRTASWSRPAECDCWAMDTLGSGVWCVVFYGLLMMIINDYSLVLFYSIWHSMLYHSIIYIYTHSIYFTTWITMYSHINCRTKKDSQTNTGDLHSRPQMFLAHWLLRIKRGLVNAYQIIGWKGHQSDQTPLVSALFYCENQVRFLSSIIAWFFCLEAPIIIHVRITIFCGSNPHLTQTFTILK